MLALLSLPRIVGATTPATKLNSDTDDKPDDSTDDNKGTGQTRGKYKARRNRLAPTFCHESHPCQYSTFLV